VLGVGMKKFLLILSMGIFLSSTVAIACDTGALKIRMDKYHSIMKKATEELNKELAKVGCGPNVKNLDKPCDHEEFAKIQAQHKEVMDYIVMDNESHGCPEHLVIEHTKKQD
jgi:F420-dependent methylenetetrahydromethanopterin dehydrogenase